MKRFVYAPDVEAYIQTNKGVLDVSDDIINGSMTLRLNAVSSFSLTLQNPHRKYLDTSMMSMDPIIIYLTRVKRMLAFSGYIDSAPIDQLYPEPVTITGSCTLKRLLYTYWNPQLPYVEQFLYSMGWTLDPLTGNILDNSGKSLFNLDQQGSLGNMMQQVLHKIGGWDLGTDKKGHRKNTSKNSVQILALPKGFIDVTKKVLTAQRAGEAQYEASVANYLNQILTVNGITTDPFGTGSSTQNVTDTVTDTNPLPVSLKGKYKAFTYGPKTNLTGFAAALNKRASKNGENLTDAECQNAATIAKIFVDHGFTAKATSAFIAVAWKAESGLIADRLQGSDPSNPEVATGSTPGDPNLVGYGLFQLTGSSWYGTSGYLTQAVRQAGGGSSAIATMPTNVSGHVQNTYAYNPVYNSTARAISISSNDKDYLNNSSNPVKLVCEIQAHGGLGSGDPGPDYTSAVRNAFDIVWAAIQDNQNTSSADSSVAGSIGDVRVGDPALTGNKTLNRTGDAIYPYTFRIKPNPFNNDTFIFAGTTYDPTLKKDEISIWYPQDSNQVASWKNGKEVSLETSLPGKPFPPSTGSSDYQNIGTAQEVLKIAHKYIGTPYVYGGTSPKGFDCSGFTQYVYNKVGISIGRDTVAQWATGPKVPSGDPLEPGDLIFFSSTGSPSDLGGVYGHVGIVVDPSAKTMIDAPHTGANVRIETYSLGQWGSDYFVGATRPAGTSNIAQITSPAASGTGTGITFTSQSFAQSVAAYGMALPLVFPMAQSAQEAQLFTGDRAYQDAQPLMNFVEFICKASGRSFKSTPRGDFFAFYPDYFNWAGQSPYFVITDIETQDLTINFTDQPLATHVYTTADTMAAGSINISEQLFSTVASVESLGSFPELVNVRKDFNYRAFLEKFGARPLNEEVLEIKNSFFQFMYGWMTFLEQWAKLFEANPTFTFMPELVPGGLVKFSSRDLSMYINEVTHNFDRESGFTTTANLISPSTSKGHYALMVINGNIESGA